MSRIASPRGPISPYTAQPIDPAFFNPAKVKDPLDAAPDSPRMDDPRFIEKQHEEQRREGTGG